MSVKPCNDGVCLCAQSLDNHVCNIFVFLHTLPPMSRNFAAFRHRLLLDLAFIVEEHGAQLAHQTQVVCMAFC